MESLRIARVAVSAAVYSIDKPYDYIIPKELEPRVKIGIRVMVSFGRGNKKCEAMVLGTAPCTDISRLKSILDVLDDIPVLDEHSIRLALWLREQCFSALYDIFRAMLPSGLWYKIEDIYKPVSNSSLEKALQAVSHLPDGEKIASYIFLNPDGVTKKQVESTLNCKKSDCILRALIDAGVVKIYSHAMRNVGDKTVKIAQLAVSDEEAYEYAISRSKRAPMQRDIVRLLIDIGASSVGELCYFTGASNTTINTLHKNGIINFVEQEAFRRPRIKKGTEHSEINLNIDQQIAYDELEVELNKQQAGCALLYGVTGSGKTLIYIKLIERTIAMSRSAIVLVPEIALTPQLVERFYSYFGDKIAILHSALSAGERFDEWKRIGKGEVFVVVGTRSAVFAPLPNIGLIIMDEEQEHTYKSCNTPRYHARNVAKFRCVQHKALLVLGSATPAVESMYQAKIGKYTLHTLPTRYNEQEMPEVIISDLREELRAGNTGSISKILRVELEKNIANGEQSILFINRRGATRYALCVECGHVPECPHCSVSLTYHSANGRFMCHHCGFSKSAISICPECGGQLSFIGAGTQKIEEELHNLFPNVETIRMDYDTTNAKMSHERLIERFDKEKIPIMIGTQMITKGLDFENVTLVGVLSAEQSLYNDDYRAAESTFALITQVVGRAGRGNKKGRAIIQTFSPNHALIRCAAAQDYQKFYESEINLRESRGFPPFRDIIGIMVSGENEHAVLAGCLRVLGKLKRALKTGWKDVCANVYGPAPTAVLKVRGKFRYKISICCVNSKRVRELVARLLCDFRSDKQNRVLTIVADVNPIDF